VTKIKITNNELIDIIEQPYAYHSNHELYKIIIKCVPITGYICQRNDLLANNCCGTTEQLYMCDTCNSDGCCVLYEHCVSCCLDPKKVSPANIKITIIILSMAYTHLATWRPDHRFQVLKYVDKDGKPSPISKKTHRISYQLSKHIRF